MKTVKINNIYLTAGELRQLADHIDNPELDEKLEHKDISCKSFLKFIGGVEGE